MEHRGAVEWQTHSFVLITVALTPSCWFFRRRLMATPCPCAHRYDAFLLERCARAQSGIGGSRTNACRVRPFYIGGRAHAHRRRFGGSDTQLLVAERVFGTLCRIRSCRRCGGQSADAQCLDGDTYGSLPVPLAMLSAQRSSEDFLMHPLTRIWAERSGLHRLFEEGMPELLLRTLDPSKANLCLPPRIAAYPKKGPDAERDLSPRASTRRRAS